MLMDRVGPFRAVIELELPGRFRRNARLPAGWDSTIAPRGPANELMKMDVCSSGSCRSWLTISMLGRAVLGGQGLRSWR